MIFLLLYVKLICQTSHHIAAYYVIVIKEWIHKCRGDWNFTQLLEEGSNNNMNNKIMMDSSQDEVHTLQFPPKVQTESITKKTQLVVISRVEENRLIVLAWLNISLDAVQGNEQKHNILE